MFARLDFRRFLVCCSGDISDDESEEKPSVAICGGSICILTVLLADRVSAYVPSRSLRSADMSLLVVPRVNLERFGRRAFSCAGPCGILFHVSYEHSKMLNVSGGT